MSSPPNLSIHTKRVPTQHWQRVADATALDVATNERLHLAVDIGNGTTRYISIIRFQGQLYCLDSVCFHAGGPLALGDIEEIEERGVACLKCPWHFYHVSIKDGQKWYQSATPGADGKLTAGEWKSVGQRQRVHQIQIRDDNNGPSDINNHNTKGIYVLLNLEGDVASDEYATKPECGARVRSGAQRMTSNMLAGLAGDGQQWDGSRSPARSASPMRGAAGVTPPASPRASSGGVYSESEDVWPEDIVLMEGRASPRRRSMYLGGSQAKERAPTPPPGS